MRKHILRQGFQQGRPWFQQGRPWFQQGRPWFQQGHPWFQQGRPFLIVVLVSTRRPMNYKLPSKVTVDQNQRIYIYIEWHSML